MNSETRPLMAALERFSIASKACFQHTTCIHLDVHLYYEVGVTNPYLTKIRLWIELPVRLRWESDSIQCTKRIHLLYMRMNSSYTVNLSVENFWRYNVIKFIRIRIHLDWQFICISLKQLSSNYIKFHSKFHQFPNIICCNQSYSNKNMEKSWICIPMKKKKNSIVNFILEVSWHV